jgi:hypothetical protein
VVLLRIVPLIGARGLQTAAGSFGEWLYELNLYPVLLKHRSENWIVVLTKGDRTDRCWFERLGPSGPRRSFFAAAMEFKVLL